MRSTTAIGINGGSQVTINNTGHIDGHIVTGAFGVVAGDTTVNNEAGSVWQTSYVTDEGTIVAAGSTITVTQSGNGMVVGNAGTNAHLTLESGAVLTADFVNVAQQPAGVHLGVHRQWSTGRLRSDRSEGHQLQLAA